MRHPRITLFAPAVLALALGGGAPTRADDKKAEAEKKVDPTAAVAAPTPEISSVLLADQLVNYGRESKLPEALVTAALILYKNPVEAVTTLDKDTVPATPTTPAGLLAEAKKMRPDDKALAASIDKAAEDMKESSRAAVGGVKTFTGAVSAGGSIRFAKGRATVTATGSYFVPKSGFSQPHTASTSVQLTVRDAKGVIVYQQSGSNPTWAATLGGEQTYHVAVQMIPTRSNQPKVRVYSN